MAYTLLLYLLLTWGNHEYKTTYGSSTHTSRTTGLPHTHQPDLAKGTPPNDLQKFEVIHSQTGVDDVFHWLLICKGGRGGEGKGGGGNVTRYDSRCH